MSNQQPATFAPSRTYDYAIVDVFAEQPLAGNALAIIPDARGLTPAEMQSIARETNLSETTFILPRSPEIERDRGIHVRIFTVSEELPFAGHPTLGTASWLYLNHPTLRGANTITLDLLAGPIPVTFSTQPGDTAEKARAAAAQGIDALKGRDFSRAITTPSSGVASATEGISAQGTAPNAPGIYATMRQNDPVFGQIHSPAAVAAAIGLTPADLDPALPIQTVSTGLPFCIVPLRSLDVAARLAIPQPLARAFLATTDAKFFHCITRAASTSGADWHARMQFYNGEDPATGSASGCAIAYLVRHSLAASDQPIVLEQGIEMLRPSRIYVRATFQNGNVNDVFVGGRTIPIANGRLFLP